jgi:hypothetical protein
MKVFISYSYADSRQLAAELAEALTKEGYEVLDPASSVNPESIQAWISTALRGSDVMIALMTNANPNVYFEAGLASGARVPVLVAADKPDHVAFALSSTPYVHLTGDIDADIEEILRRMAEIRPEHEVADTPVSQPAELTLAAAAADDEVLERLAPMEFERLVAELLQKRGFPAQGQSLRGDRGFDILIDGDPPTVVEVKRYTRGALVSVGVVRQLLGAMVAAGAGRAILISSSGFTRSAIAAAAEWPIDLMTLEDLLQFPEANAGTRPSLGRHRQ